MSEQEKDLTQGGELDEALTPEATEAAPETKAPKGDKPSKDGKASKGGKKKKDGPGFFGRIARWFREMKSELKKVVWPTGKATWKNTLTVIVCVIIVGVFIWLFDLLAKAVISALLALAGKS